MASRVSTPAILLQMMEDVLQNHHLDLVSVILIYLSNKRQGRRIGQRNIRAAYGHLMRIPEQVRRKNRLFGVTDVSCLDNLRMDRNAFGRLCQIIKQSGDLVDGRFVTVEEQVAMFLGILAHHKKNRVVRFDFWRSSYTVSRYVHRVLRAILRLQGVLMVHPIPIPNDCDDNRWKWFKGCLGALDGTYINVQVANDAKPRYRSRKGQICTNTLAVCDHYLNFVYVLPGWEGSAGDARVLRDAMNRVNGLRVPQGNYYLCDNGYANSEGFLTPYKGVRYHLKEWGPGTEAPQNPRELFNLRHTRARNVIERAFAVIKMRWGILRSASYYPMNGGDGAEIIDEGVNTEFVDGVEPSTEWNVMRDTLAESMWNTYQEHGY
ncbi:uncharacterized protein LOC125197835 isoform X2 [Salvia hispanica]|uniref:uncharacterized protein LOC125197835 isoform X2 n=1 Tax=Salvia hispanica TaxID=49212 RepID=UPI0020090B76|nr:uncharacterized protein LOC125197835 isoform X2 [Salvia hispanica]